MSRIHYAALVLSFYAVILGGCSFVSDSNLPQGQKDEPAVTKSIAITGLVNLESGDDVTPLAAASVKLVKIQNKLETEIASSTSDDNGQFSFSGIDSTILTNGEQDYYYEVRATSATDSLSAVVVAEDSIDVLVDFSSTVVARSLRHAIKDLSQDKPAEGVSKYHYISYLRFTVG